MKFQLNDPRVSGKSTGRQARSVYKDIEDNFKEQENRFNDSVFAKAYGAIADSVTDNAAFLQTGMNDAVAKNRTLILSEGEYSINASSLNFTGSLRIVGAGIDKTRILWKNDSISLFRKFGGARLSYIEIADMEIVGNWLTNQNDGATRYPIQIEGVDFVRLRNVGVRYARNIAVVMNGNNYVYIHGCRLRECARDGFNLGGCSYVAVVDNEIDKCDDDAVNISNPAGAIPPRHNLIVSNNRISDSQGIKIQDARYITISGNVIERCRNQGISVGHDAGTSANIAALLAINVVGNAITDVIDRGNIDGLAEGSSFIGVNARDAFAGSGGSAILAPPGENIPASATVIEPYAYYASNDAVSPRPAASYINVSDNVCIRTLPVVANYSQYNYGLMFLRSGYVNPAMSIKEIGEADGIRIGGTATGKTVRNLTLNNNIFAGVKNGVNFGSGSFRDIDIKNNQFVDFSANGIFFSSATKSRVNIEGNLFDGDPWHKSLARLANGAWTDTEDLVAVRSNPAFIGAELVGNRIRNVSRIWAGAKPYCLHNRVYAQPVGIGYNAANKGVGNILPTGIQFKLVYEDCSPSSATFGEVQNYAIEEASAMPTFGFFTVNHFVSNLSPAVASGKVLLGWKRLTTGSAHVAGTDWTPVYGSTT